MSRVAVVTGVASGIGRALAGALVTRGDTVVADIDGEGAERAAGELARRGPGTATRRWSMSATPGVSGPWWTRSATGMAGST